MTFPGQVALADFTVAVDAGEVHGLVGQNGSGKSTFIKVLAGYHAPDPGGHVVVAGSDLSFAAPQESRRLGLRFMHQNLGVIDELTVVENMALASGYARHRGRIIDWPEQRRKTAELLARLGVELDVDELAGHCAPVERTALAVARALDEEEGEIRVLVLDEPTAALPPTEVDRLFGVIHQVRAHSVAVIYVSHRLDEVEDLADRVSILRDGRLQGTFTMSDLNRSQLVELIVGEEVKAATRPHRTHHGSVTAEAPPVALTVTELEAENLHPASFEVRTGEILGFAGLAGSGREEAIRALVGAIPATAASVVVGDIHLARQSPAAALDAGLVLIPANRQRGSAVSEFVIRENTTLPSVGRYRKSGVISKHRERADASRWIKELDVQPADSEHLFSQLSGGNQQKVSLGKWLNTDPRVIALTDPTAGVDVKAREAIYQIVSSLAASGQSFVISSADVEDLVVLCDRVLIFRDGHIVAELSGETVTEQSLLNSMTRVAGRSSPSTDLGGTSQPAIVKENS